MLYLLYRIGRRLALMLPIGVCYAAAVFMADVYYFFAHRDRKELDYNLRGVFENENKKVIRKYIRGIFRNFAKYLADFFRSAKLDQDYILRYVAIEGKENLDKALAKGKGVILAGAHMGNWELGGSIIASFGYPLYVIALEHKDSRINDFFVQQRTLSDSKVIPVGAQLKSCFRVLQRNGILGIVGDRNFSKNGVDMDFFGRKANFPKGAAFFGLKTGAPVVPTLTLRMKDETFKLVFEKPITCDPGRSGEAGIVSILGQYIRVIEKYIRSYPDQWYAFRKVWQE